MHAMFHGCTSGNPCIGNRLVSLTLPSGFGRNATTMQAMFFRNPALTTLNIPNDTEHPENNFGYSVEDSSRMFSRATSIRSLTFPIGFGTNLKFTVDMFISAQELAHIYVAPNTNWNSSILSQSGNMFTDTNLPRYASATIFDARAAHIAYEGSSVWGFFEAYPSSTTNQSSSPSYSNSSLQNSSNNQSSTPTYLNNSAQTYNNDQNSGIPDLSSDQSTSGPESTNNTEEENNDPLGVITGTDEEGNNVAAIVIAYTAITAAGTTTAFALDKRHRNKQSSITNRF